MSEKRNPRPKNPHGPYPRIDNVRLTIRLSVHTTVFLPFSFLMFNSIKDMYKAANWDGKGFHSRKNLMEKLQSTESSTHQSIYFFPSRISPTGHHAATETARITALSSSRTATRTLYIPCKARQIDTGRCFSAQGSRVHQVSRANTNPTVDRHPFVQTQLSMCDHPDVD